MEMNFRAEVDDLKLQMHIDEYVEKYTKQILKEKLNQKISDEVEKRLIQFLKEPNSDKRFKSSIGNVVMQQITEMWKANFQEINDYIIRNGREPSQASKFFNYGIEIGMALSELSYTSKEDFETKIMPDLLRETSFRLADRIRHDSNKYNKLARAIIMYHDKGEEKTDGKV